MLDTFFSIKTANSKVILVFVIYLPSVTIAYAPNQPRLTDLYRVKMAGPRQPTLHYTPPLGRTRALPVTHQFLQYSATAPEPCGEGGGPMIVTEGRYITNTKITLEFSVCYYNTYPSVTIADYHELVGWKIRVKCF